MSAEDTKPEEDLALEEPESEEPTVVEEAAAEEAPEADRQRAEEAPAAEEAATEEAPAAADAKPEEDVAVEEPQPEEPTVVKEAAAEEAPAAGDTKAEEVLVLEERVSEEALAARKAGAKKAAVAKEPLKGKTVTKLDVGLSDDERNDLQELIQGLKQEPSGSPPRAAVQDIQKQMKSMSKRLSQLGTMLLKHDAKMKSFYEIMRLYYQKTQAMNKRLDAIVESIKTDRMP